MASEKDYGNHDTSCGENEGKAVVKIVVPSCFKIDAMDIKNNNSAGNTDSLEALD